MAWVWVQSSFAPTAYRAGYIKQLIGHSCQPWGIVEWTPTQSQLRQI